MVYFTKDYVDFFRSLSQNNNTSWFHQNKKVYEQHIKKPFERFIADLIQHASNQDTTINISPSDAIMRINRDIRFSADKSPYQLYMSAIISKTGKKDKSYPGMYIQIGHEGIKIFGGSYMPDKNQLLSIRHAILEQSKSFINLAGNKNFIEKFGKILGDTAKKIDEPFKSAASTNPYLLHKQFYWEAHFPAKHIDHQDIFTLVVGYYDAMLPLNHFLENAMKS